MTTPWLVRPPAADQPARLFCFPFSGAGASAFSAWPSTLDDIEVCPVQFPGRENRLAHPHYGSYEQLADSLVEALAPLLDRPYAFFGHCAGAIPAFEAVVRLAERGLRTPECLFVSGQPAPHDASRDRMLAMSEPELRGELEAFLLGRGITPRRDVIEMGLSVLLDDHAAAGRYRRAEPVAIPCPVVVVHWRDDPEVSLGELAGWGDYSASVDFQVVVGGHYDFMDAPDQLRKVLTTWR